MYTAYRAAELKQTTASTRRVSNFLRNCWGAFQEWRKRERLRADLYALNDSALADIGISPGEIDYVVNLSIDQRGRGR